MSFTAHRVYQIANAQIGVDYNPSTNGNVAIKIRARYEATAPFAVTVVSFQGGTNPFTQIGSMANPVIEGPGYPGREPITGSSDPIIQTALFNPASTGFPDGTYDYYVYDGAIPSSLDSPILAFHVVAQSAPPVTPGDDLVITTLTGDNVTFTGGSLVLGGIYEYSIASVGGPGSIFPATTVLLGLAPASRSNQW